MFLLIILLYALSFILFFYVILQLIFPVKTALEEQIEFYRQAWKSSYGEAIEVGGEKTTTPFNQALDLTKKLAEKRGFISLIDKQLERSGLSIEVSKFIFFHLVSIITAGLIGYIFYQSLATAILLILTATFLPWLGLSFLEEQRRKKFATQLPETLTLISSSLRAGFGFQQAVRAVVKETSPPTSTEFKKFLSEVELGLPLELALDNMADRLKSPNFNWVVMAVKIQREVGGNLSEVLENLAKTVREREQLQRQVKALTAEGRLSAWILTGLPFAISIFLFIVNPEYMSLIFKTKIGLMMLAAAVVLMTIGVIWMRKIVRIEV